MKKVTLFFSWTIIIIILIINFRVNAAILVVTNNNDSGPGSLRAVINKANARDKIIFNLTAGRDTIVINSALPAIYKTLTIDGSNTAGNGIAVTVQVADPGVSQFRVFLIADTFAIDTIENITIKGGDISKLVLC